MRKLIDKNKLPPVGGDTRVRRKFLLFPRRFLRDWRWLEYANILEVYWVGGMNGSGFWEENNFVDNRTRYIESIEAQQLNIDDK